MFYFRGTSGIDIDLRNVDIDQCPSPEGASLNIFADTDKCKETTTVNTHASEMHDIFFVNIHVSTELVPIAPLPTRLSVAAEYKHFDTMTAEPNNRRITAAHYNRSHASSL